MSEPGHHAVAPLPAPSKGDTTTWALFDAMGEHARRRLTPTFDGAIGAAGGVLVAGGMVTAGAGDSVSRGGVAAVAAVLIAVGLIARLVLDAPWRAVRTGAVALGAVGIVALAATVPDDTSSNFLRTLFLIATIGFVVAWLVPGYRGHPVMLALALLTFAGLLADVLASDSRASFGGPFGLGIDGGLNAAVGRILLVAGLGYLAGVWFFDRRGYAGVGTAFAVAALATTTIGAFGVASDLGDEGGSLLILVVGTVVCAVGARSDRRATAWWGAALGALGAASLAVSLFQPESASGNGVTVAVAGALMVGATTLLTLRRRRPTPTPTTTLAPPPGPSLPPSLP